MESKKSFWKKSTQKIKDVFVRNKEIVTEEPTCIKEDIEDKHIDLEKEKRKSLLSDDTDRIYITDKIYIRIPTVREILEDEQTYYSIVSSLTASPYQYMVQLNDMGIDYTKINNYELFMMLFPIFAKSDLSIIFGDLYTSDYNVYIDNSNSTKVIHSPTNGIDYKIDEFLYTQIIDVLRKINNIEKVTKKPGNEEAKRYLLEKERKKQKRNAKKPYEPYLEKMVIALVNRPEFKYNYEETMNLSIYKFNESFKQIQTSINFDKTMIGVYAGTVDTSKIKDKSCLSWIPIK